MFFRCFSAFTSTFTLYRFTLRFRYCVVHGETRIQHPSCLYIPRSVERSPIFCLQGLCGWLINIAHSGILCDHVPDWNIDGSNVFSLAFWKATSKTFRALNSLHFSFALSRKYKSSIYYHNYFMSESPRRFLMQQPFTAYRAADVPVIWVAAWFTVSASFFLPFRELVSAQVLLWKPMTRLELITSTLQVWRSTIELHRLSRKASFGKNLPLLRFLIAH